MPKLDGYGFLSELRQQEIPQQPAIMVSTEAAAGDEKAAYQAGANCYLSNLSGQSQLIAHVRVSCSGRRIAMNPLPRPSGAVLLRIP